MNGLVVVQVEHQDAVHRVIKGVRDEVERRFKSWSSLGVRTLGKVLVRRRK